MSLIKIEGQSMSGGRRRDAGARHLLRTREAAAVLGVKPESLYAYVSRGLLERHRVPGDRGSWFDPGEVDRLASRGRGGAGAPAAPRGGRRVESGGNPPRPHA